MKGVEGEKERSEERREKREMEMGEKGTVKNETDKESCCEKK